MKLSDEIYIGIKKLILTHKLMAGVVLHEDELATQFGCSRVPAREALQRLEREGLVVRSGRKYVVRIYTLEDVIVIFKIRAALEQYGAVAAIQRGMKADIILLEENLAAQEVVVGGDDRGTFSELDMKFHLIIAGISGNKLLYDELHKILEKVILIRSLELARDRGMEVAFHDHCRLFDALRRRDSGIFIAELEYHFSTIVDLHLNVVSPRPSQKKKRNIHINEKR